MRSFDHGRILMPMHHFRAIGDQMDSLNDPEDMEVQDDQGGGEVSWPHPLWMVRG